VLVQRNYDGLTRRREAAQLAIAAIPVDERYERGRRDAIRDAIAHLMATSFETPEYAYIKEQCEALERLTAVEPAGAGRVWP
jgi:hypothetical protein